MTSKVEREWKLQGFLEPGLRTHASTPDSLLAKAHPEVWGAAKSLQVARVQGEVKTGTFCIQSATEGTPQDIGRVSTVSLSPTPGTVCDFRLSYGRVLSRSSKIIIVNRNRKEMLINSDMFWKPQEAVQGEPSEPRLPQHAHLGPSPGLRCSWLVLGVTDQGLDPAPGGTQLFRVIYLGLRLVSASG